MAKGVKVGVSGAVRDVTNIKQGVSGVVKSINSGTVGVSGTSRRYWGEKILDRVEIRYNAIWGETLKQNDSGSWTIDSEVTITPSQASNYGTITLYTNGGYINSSTYKKGILCRFAYDIYFKGESKAYHPWELIKSNDSETTSMDCSVNYTIYYTTSGTVNWQVWPYLQGFQGSASSGNHTITTSENSVVYEDNNLFGIVKVTNDTSSIVDIGWTINDFTYNGVTVKPKVTQVPSGWTLPT